MTIKKFTKLFKQHGSMAFSALAVLLIASMAIANTGTIIEHADTVNINGGSDSLGGVSFVDPASGFNDVTIGNDLLVSGDLEVTGTTTQSVMELSSTFSKALTFTAAATTTPGGLFSFQNTGAPRICTTVTVDIQTADSAGGALGGGHPFDFSVATSTGASVYSTKSASVMATSTKATSTSPLLSNHVSPGSYIGGDQDQGSAPWVWGNGVYLLGAFDSLSTYAATSTAAYTTMVGEVHVYCIAR